MDDTEKKLPDVVEEHIPQQASLPAEQPVQVPMYRRDLFPTNLVLSAEDLEEFADLICEVNERSKERDYPEFCALAW